MQSRTFPASRRLRVILVLMGQALWACQSVSPAPVLVSPPTPEELSTQAGNSSSPATPGAPSGCFYVWATRELPSLSAKLNADLAAVGNDYTGSAYAFGEDCRHDDGATTFLAMETDFRVRVVADSLSDKTAMGTAILKVMRVVEALPASEVQGTRPGRVEFEFYVGPAESLRLNIDISKFRAEADNLEGSALLEHFQWAP